jgi:hypothetical protein
MANYRAEVQVAGEPNKWHTNAIVLPTHAEALDYGRDLASRWLLATDVRVTETDDEANYRFADHRLEAIQ